MKSDEMYIVAFNGRSDSSYSIVPSESIKRNTRRVTRQFWPLITHRLINSCSIPNSNGIANSRYVVVLPSYWLSEGVPKTIPLSYTALFLCWCMKRALIIFMALCIGFYKRGGESPRLSLPGLSNKVCGLEFCSGLAPDSF